MSLFEKSFFRIDQADDGAYGKRLSESAPGGKRYSDKNIGEIAAIMGFSSQFHFSDFFKRMTGSSPLHYKKELLQQAAANKRP